MGESAKYLKHAVAGLHGIMKYFSEIKDMDTIPVGL